MPAPTVDLAFPCLWQAEVLAKHPLISPPRHFTYPRQAEEADRGALEVLVRPGPAADPFLATCVLGFRDPVVPTGVWSCPDPDEMCAVAGGYTYMIDTASPDRFSMLAYRPVLEVRPLLAAGLLLFVGHHGILAWGADGLAWESQKLSDEGVAIERIADDVLEGRGWSMSSDQETPFRLDLGTGFVLGQPR